MVANTLFILMVTLPKFDAVTQCVMRPIRFNSLFPGRWDFDSRFVDFKLNLEIGRFQININLKWMPKVIVDGM